MSYYADYLKDIASTLDGLEVTGADAAGIDREEGFQQWVGLTRRASEAGRSIYMVGNGASAAMASHMSADATKNGRLRAKPLNDIALVTAASNDVAYEDVYAVQLERYADEDDLLFTISSSGNSPNIIRSIEMARDRGMGVVTLSGMKEGNRSRSMGDLNFWVPSGYYGHVECAHQVLLHCWLDRYLDEYHGGKV